MSRTESTSSAEAALVEVLREARGRGVFSAAAALIAVDGEVVARCAVGGVRAWDAPGVPAAHPGARATIDTIFDIASVTKLFTAATLLTALDDRGADASLPVADVLPEFRDPALRRITPAQLLDHTAGFAAEWADRAPDPGARRFRQRARPLDPPGSVHRYSCVGYIWAGLAAEALCGEPLETAVRRAVLDPLGLAATGFRPAPALRGRIAATEFQPGRGLVHGDVHDETAWALGGVAGNAGLFGSAPDLLRFAEALRRPPGSAALPAAVVRAMTEPVALAGRPPGGAPDAVPSRAPYGQALGPRVDEEWMRPLSDGRAVGHTGFTGTALAAEPGGSVAVVFLSNRVHPVRTSDEIVAVRRAVAEIAGTRGDSR